MCCGSDVTLDGTYPLQPAHDLSELSGGEDADSFYRARVGDLGGGMRVEYVFGSNPNSTPR